MSAPVTTVFDGNKEDFGKIKKKIVRGIVRQYTTPGSRHRPYTGILNDPTDLSKHEIKNLQQLLDDFPDGEKIEIVVVSQGESHSAHGFVWMLTEPHIYERVPLNEWQNTFPKDPLRSSEKTEAKQ